MNKKIIIPDNSEANYKSNTNLLDKLDAIIEKKEKEKPKTTENP